MIKQINVSYDISDAYDELSFKRALAADDLVFAINEFLESLHRMIEREDDSTQLEQCRVAFLEILNDHGININKLS